jgi:hypothetical protein
MALVPFYRLRNGAEHFYTASTTERDDAIANYGYVYEEIACYVSDSPEPVVPLDLALWTQFYIASVPAVSLVDNNGQNLLSTQQLAERATAIADACLAAYKKWYSPL